MWKIELEDHQKVWITSDTHYNHKNICRGTSKWTHASNMRNFDTLSHMNETIINNINEVVGYDDVLIHLGDWSFGGFESIAEFRNRIVCKQVSLVLGNHDHHIENNRDGIQDLFAHVTHYTRMEVKTKDTTHKFVLQHFPIISWQDMAKGTFHLFGHMHLPANKKMMPGRSMDVGMDGNNLKPYELKSIINTLSGRPVQHNAIADDHHDKMSVDNMRSQILNLQIENERLFTKTIGQ